VVAFNDNMGIVESQQIQVGPMDRWSVHVAELIGIFHAVGTVFKMAHQRVRPEGRQVTATILCESRSALQAIKSVRNKSGQRIVHAIHQAAIEVQTAEIALRLQWVPGHCDNPGNDAADRMAKHAASPGKSHPFRPLLTRERAFIRSNIAAQWEQEWRTSSKGGHLRKIDDTLPATHTRKLYGSLPRGRAYLLTQLRTGHNWLSTYRKKIGYSDDDRCDCGAHETVVHVLVDCPMLAELRRKLRREGRLKTR
jgi:ribonuclease HI